MTTPKNTLPNPEAVLAQLGFDIDLEGAAAAVAARLASVAPGEKSAALAEFARAAILLDLDFIARSGAAEGAAYDEDAAFANLRAGLKKNQPKLARLAEDFSEIWEEYLDEAGIIEWD